MKHRETVTVPEHKEERIFYIRCDFCNEEVGSDENFGVEEVTIKYRHGEHYPDGKFVDVEEVDMCHRCWSTKLVPWIKDRGVKIQKFEED